MNKICWKSLFVAILICAVFFVLTGCSESPALDEVYESDYYTVEYSSQWNKDEMEHLGILDAVSFYFEEDNELQSIGIIVEDNVFVSPDQYLAVEELEMMLSDFELRKQESVELNEYEAEKLIYSSYIAAREIIFYQVATVKDNIGYVLTFSVMRENEEQLLPSFEQVLKSFQLK